LDGIRNESGGDAYIWMYWVVFISQKPG